MDQGHDIVHAVECQTAAVVVHVHADSRRLRYTQWRLHIAVPGCEVASIPLQAPGEVVARDATVALLALTFDALVGQSHVCSLAADVHLKVVTAHVEALCGQHLPPVLEAFRDVWVAVLPGGGVGHFVVIFRQTQELVDCVAIKVKWTGV